MRIEAPNMNKPINNAVKDGAKQAKIAEDTREKDRQAALDNVLTNPGSSFSITGTEEERDRAIQGLETAGMGYGQGLPQIGEDIQRVRDLQRGRTEQSGSDPVSEAIRAQKQGAMAVAQRQMANQGVKGGVAAGAVDQIGRNRDADIAASLYGQQRQSIADERSLASNMLSGTTSLMYGSQAAGSNIPNPPQTSGMFGTVICTELYNQGKLPYHIYVKDAEYGRSLDTEVIVGYQLLAYPVVQLMKKSELFSKIIAVPATLWAKHIANEEWSYFGVLCQQFGEPICGFIGKLKIKLSGVKI